MPDGRFVPLGAYESRAIAHRHIGEQQASTTVPTPNGSAPTRHSTCSKDVIGNAETIRGLSDALEDAKGWLDNAKAQIRAVCEGRRVMGEKIERPKRTVRRAATSLSRAPSSDDLARGQHAIEGCRHHVDLQLLQLEGRRNDPILHCRQERQVPKRGF